MRLTKLILVLVVLLLSARAYEIEEEVLVLHDSDFPAIIDEFNYILIEFYAPWCGHCQKLAPHYTEAAKALAEKGSKIKLAKVDATKDPTAASDYGVSGYPTIFFFLNGTKIDFNGDRTKEAIIGWLEKKILPATSEISSQEDVDKLAQDGSVNLVLFSTNEQDLSDFVALAAADDYNKYYVAAGELVKKYTETTVEIVRDFGGVQTFKGLGDNFAAWIAKHARPLVLDFDDRTVKDIFQKQKRAVILFNKEGSEYLKEVLTTASQASESGLLFVEILPENEHYERFAEFIKLNVDAPKLIALKSDEQKKAVYSGEVSALTIDELNQFITGVERETVKLIGLQDESEPTTTTEEEPAEGEEGGEEGEEGEEL